MKTNDIKSMGLAYLEVLEGKKAVNKHGHDHVGQEDDDVNNDKKVDSTDKYLLNRRKAISANIKKEEVEELGEISAVKLGQYSTAAAQPKNQGAKKDKRIAGQHMADQKVRKKYGYSSNAKVAAGSLPQKENTEWPVFNRILEKSDKFTVKYNVSGVGDDPHEITMKFADPNHVKGATKPEKMGDTMSAGEKSFVDQHGGLDGNDSGIHGHKAAAHTAKAATAGVKVAPGRHNDSKIGDKTMPKAKG